MERKNPIIWPSTTRCFAEEYDTLPPELKRQYVYNTAEHFWELPEPTWLKWRAHGPYWFDKADPRYINYTIGGSDAAVLYDGSELEKVLYLYEGQHGNEYQRVFGLWASKLGRDLPFARKPIDPDIAFEGHVEEETIRRYFERQYKKDHIHDEVEVINDCHFYQSTVVPGLVCNLDGLVRINGKLGVFEAKTVHPNSEDFPLWKQRIVPLKYYLQACIYMLCTNLNFTYICCKLGMGEIVYIKIMRNDLIEEAIIRMLRSFFDLLEDEIEPDLDSMSPAAVAEYWRQTIGFRLQEETGPVELSEEYVPVVKELSSIQEDLKLLDQQADELKKRRLVILNEKIFPVMGRSNFARLNMSDGTQINLRLRFAKDTRGVDKELLQSKDPALYKEYLHVEEVETFDQKAFKADHPELWEEFAAKPELTKERLNYCEVKRKSA